MIKFFFS
jgi:hypothetical protein